MEFLLNSMGLGRFVQHFEEQKFTLKEFVNIDHNQVPLILPSPKFSLADCLEFMQKYTSFVSSGLIESALQTVAAEDEPSTRTEPPLLIATSSNKTDDFIELELDSNEFNPNMFLNDVYTEKQSSDDNIAITISGTISSDKSSESNIDDLLDKDFVPSEVVCDDSSASRKPLVDHTQLGSSRRISKNVEKAIDELDLHKLFDGHPLCAAILKEYQMKKLLSRDNRSKLSNEIILWFLPRTEYPKRHHYEALVGKICELFPSEKPSIWYLALKSSCPKQKYPKGVLPDKMRNMKDKIHKKQRCKVKRTKRGKLVAPAPQPVNRSQAETAAQEWLMRNSDPECEVRKMWRVSSVPRLKELITKFVEPHSYIEMWNNILKLPFSYQLILDDFEQLPHVESKYECLRGKSANLIMHWSDFVRQILYIVKSTDLDSGLKTKETKEFLDLYDKAANQNNRDLLILSLLPSLCKQRGRVSLGGKTLKPSSIDSKEAFILHVSGAGEFDQSIKARQERHLRLGIPVQPYVIVLGKPHEAQASYVIVNDVPWKVSSVLQSIEVCMKTCFALNCNYPAEALHLWLFVQRYLYKIAFPDDPNVSAVDIFIQKLECVPSADRDS